MSKAKLINLVKKLGGEVDLERDYIGVRAPKGKVFGDHFHYSGYGVGREESRTRAEAYQNLIDELSSIEDCQDDECRDGCSEYNQNERTNK